MPNQPEYFISHIINKTILENTIVDKWPMHLTIVPPFIIPDSIDNKIILEQAKYIGQNLGIIKLGYGAIRSGAIPIEIGNESMYGDNFDVPVVEIIDPSGKLHLLHSQLMLALQNLGCIYINPNPNWIYKNYSPHVTTKSGNKLDRPFFCTTLSLNQKTEKVKTVQNTIDIIKIDSLNT